MITGGRELGCLKPDLGSWAWGLASLDPRGTCFSCHLFQGIIWGLRHQDTPHGAQLLADPLLPSIVSRDRLQGATKTGVKGSRAGLGRFCS